jgi:hypothetical protein
MQNLSKIGSHFAAALSAIALSLVLISGTVSIPGNARAATAAYVGEVA